MERREAENGKISDPKFVCFRTIFNRGNSISGARQGGHRQRPKDNEREEYKKSHGELHSHGLQPPAWLAGTKSKAPLQRLDDEDAAPSSDGGKRAPLVAKLTSHSLRTRLAITWRPFVLHAEGSRSDHRSPCKGKPSPLLLKSARARAKLRETLWSHLTLSGVRSARPLRQRAKSTRTKTLSNRWKCIIPFNAQQQRRDKTMSMWVLYDRKAQLENSGVSSAAAAGSAGG